jgi:Ca2+/Na+ antiporter
MFPSIEPSEVGLTGLLWLLLSYGYVLFKASNLISEGSDLLLLVPSLAGFVGGTVLPLLGAVPDGAILLFSGLGSIDTAQETLSVGVGALAGSTIMLLTVPWGLSVFAGRVDIVDDTPQYTKKPKLSVTGGLLETIFETGVALSSQVRYSAIVMMVSTIPYFLIQIPASILEINQNVNNEDMAGYEKYWALSGFLLCVLGFIVYLAFQLRFSNHEAEQLKRLAVVKEYVYNGDVSLDAVMGKQSFETTGLSDYQSIEHARTTIPREVQENLSEILKSVFLKYDRDGNGALDKIEVARIMRDVHSQPMPEKRLDELYKRFDRDGDGTIDFNEFIHLMWTAMVERRSAGDSLHAVEQIMCTVGEFHHDENGEEAEEVPEDFSELSPEQQQVAILKRAFTFLALGTFLVVLFSDPMVEVLQEVANRINVSPFYVSFVLAPLASNASEVIASVYYAGKKTRKTITVSMTTLEGAASMNNTFCLSILLGLIYFRGLVWAYTAETIAIVLVQFIVGRMTMSGQTMSCAKGLFILSLFPISIALVAGLEALGFD